MGKWGRIGYGLWHLFEERNGGHVVHCGTRYAPAVIEWHDKPNPPKEFNRKGERQVCATCQTASERP
jgi:hypothetical protein